MAGRTRGSCRFDPYIKVQFWDGKALAWKDIQRSFDTAPEARSFAPAGKFRLVTVTEAGRTFGPAEDKAVAKAAAP